MHPSYAPPEHCHLHVRQCHIGMSGVKGCILVGCEEVVPIGRECLYTAFPMCIRSTFIYIYIYISISYIMYIRTYVHRLIHDWNANHCSSELLMICVFFLQRSSIPVLFLISSKYFVLSVTYISVFETFNACTNPRFCLNVCLSAWMSVNGSLLVHLCLSCRQLPPWRMYHTIPWHCDLHTYVQTYLLVPVCQLNLSSSHYVPARRPCLQRTFSSVVV